jgi:RNA polymerase sigma factor (sigma-70 family)
MVVRSRSPASRPTRTADRQIDRLPRRVSGSERGLRGIGAEADLRGGTGQRASYDVRRADARPWLYGIAGNHIRRHRRDEMRKLRALRRTGVDEVVESFADRVDARLTAGVEIRSLALAIAKLSAEQREVLLLICWAQLSYDQVAEAVSVPTGTVRSRMNHARTKLRAALGAEKGPANV